MDLSSINLIDMSECLETRIQQLETSTHQLKESTQQLETSIHQLKESTQQFETSTQKLKESTQINGTKIQQLEESTRNIGIRIQQLEDIALDEAASAAAQLVYCFRSKAARLLAPRAQQNPTKAHFWRLDQIMEANAKTASQSTYKQCAQLLKNFLVQTQLLSAQDDIDDLCPTLESLQQPMYTYPSHPVLSDRDITSIVTIYGNKDATRLLAAVQWLEHRIQDGSIMTIPVQ